MRKSLTTMMMALVFALILQFTQSFGQDGFAVQVNPNSGSRSGSKATEQARQFRQWQAQYQAYQNMLREEQLNWQSNTSARPSWNAAPQFQLPYDPLYSRIPGGRRYVYMGDYRAF